MEDISATLVNVALKAGVTIGKISQLQPEIDAFVKKLNSLTQSKAAKPKKDAPKPRPNKESKPWEPPAMKEVNGFHMYYGWSVKEEGENYKLRVSETGPKHPIFKDMLIPKANTDAVTVFNNYVDAMITKCPRTTFSQKDGDTWKIIQCLADAGFTFMIKTKKENKKDDEPKKE